MPIKRVYTDSLHTLVLDQTCAACAATNTVSVDSLALGAGRNRHQIALPPCACGATECLIRTFDAAPAHMAAHRKTVNALAEHLVKKGQVHPDHVEAVKADERKPADMGSLVGSV